MIHLVQSIAGTVHIFIAGARVLDQVCVQPIRPRHIVFRQAYTIVLLGNRRALMGHIWIERPYSQDWKETERNLLCTAVLATDFHETRSKTVVALVLL